MCDLLDSCALPDKILSDTEYVQSLGMDPLAFHNVNVNMSFWTIVDAMMLIASEAGKRHTTVILTFVVPMQEKMKIVAG